jgi:hypothetical protein
MVSPYNMAAQRPRAGLRERDYNNHLHASIPAKPGKGNSRPNGRFKVPSAKSCTEPDEKPFDAPPESSSDEERKTPPPADLNAEEEEELSPIMRTKSKFPPPRAPKGGHPWSDKPQAAQQKDEEKEETVFGVTRQRVKGYPSKRNKNIHTASSVTKPVKKPLAARNDSKNGFKMPASTAAAMAMIDDEVRSTTEGSESEGSLEKGAEKPLAGIKTTGKREMRMPIDPLPALKKSRPVFKEPIDPVSKIKLPTRKSRRQKLSPRNGGGTKTLPEARWDMELAARVDPDLSTRLNAFKEPPARSVDSSQLSSPLSSVPSSPRSDAHSFDLDPASSMTTVVPFEDDKPRCPMCHLHIDPKQLTDFMDTHYPALPSAKRLTVQQQQLFCNHHRCADAEIAWQERGYPSMNWALLPSRLSSLEAHIRSVIEDTVPSFWRERVQNRHEKQRQKGGRQTVVRELHSEGDGAELLGYYGSKGGRLIGEWIGNIFREELGESVQKDRDLARCGGLGGFMQAILVPEVISQLIMEDLSTSEEGAREAMEESSELGRLLCEEDEDEVLSDAEDLGYGE